MVSSAGDAALLLVFDDVTVFSIPERPNVYRWLIRDRDLPESQ
jgi:hypothetical protein